MTADVFFTGHQLSDGGTRRFCLITGVAGGIGQATAAAFAKSGYAVIGTDQVPMPPELPVAAYLQADLDRTVTDIPYADEVMSKLRTVLGSAGLHVLVNNAAVQRLGGSRSLTRADWLTTLNVNVMAPFLWSQALLPELETAGGSVVNISSIHARLTKPDFVAYATSKAALSGLTRAMAVDLGGRVRVNAVEPAAVSTAMLRAGFEGQPNAYAQLEACHPQGRVGTPEEIAALVLAITSGELRFLHGACIGIDGGIASRIHDPA